MEGVKGRGGLAVTCCVVMFLYAVYLGAISVLLPFIGSSFGLGAAVQGRLFPANCGGFIVGVLVCGYLSDRWGRKTVLLLGIAGYALGLGLFGSAPTFGVALVASALVGAGSGAMEAVASALATDLFPERKAFILNTIQVAFGAGATCSPTLAHWLLTTGTDWRTLYFGLAVVNVGLFVALSLQVVPPPSSDDETLDFAALRAVLRRPAFGALCLAQAFYVGAEIGFFSWMPTYFHARLPNGAAWEGLVVSVFWIAMTVGRVATVGLITRMPLTRLIALLAGGGALFSLLALFGNAPLPVMVFVGLTGLCFSGIFGVIMGETGERFPTAAGTAFGCVVASGGVGGALLPWAIGVGAETALGWRGALALVPLATFGVLLLALFVKRQP
jgi:FHS family glucose/mannose:H+ symporter-like MFS transporter